MSQVIDYSAGLPGAQAIKAKGYVGAVRYIGFPDRTKCTNRGEFVDFTNNQLGMALVFENKATDWRGGYGAGQVSGRRGRDHANGIGFPADRPIYMAIDQDVVISGEFGTMIEYLRGAGSSLGGSAVTGVYGEADVVDRARDAGVASFFWQTAAWSRGRRTSANLFQRIGTVSVGGIACDINDVLTPDWGQHNYEGDDMPTLDEIENMIKTKILAGDWRFDRNSNPIDMLRQASGAGLDNGGKLDKLASKIDALTTLLGDDESKTLIALQGLRGDILGAVAAIPQGGQPSEEQVANLAAQIKAGLGEEVAEAVGRKLVAP